MQYLEAQSTCCPQQVFAADINYMYKNASRYIAESLYDSHGSSYFLLSVNDYHNNHNISIDEQNTSLMLFLQNKGILPL